MLQGGNSSPEALSLIAEIRKVFGKVGRGKGVTLHETAVIDQYGSEAERQKARRNDTDCHWWEVKDEWIEEIRGVGGLSFLDGEGFRYYLPAYLTYWLRKGREPDRLAFHLESTQRRDFDQLFQHEQKVAIARCLEYLRVAYDDTHSEKALKKFWHRYLEG